MQWNISESVGCLQAENDRHRKSISFKQNEQWTLALSLTLFNTRREVSFPYFFEVNFEQIRIIIHKGGLNGQGLAPLRFEIVFCHIWGRDGQSVQRTLV